MTGAVTSQLAVLTPPRERDQVVTRLGAGGMAEVFLVRRTGPGGFEKYLALKRIRPDLDAFEYGPMFLREARLVAALQHPNIVQVHDAGSDDTGLWFLMEYVHGRSLGAVLQRAQERGSEVPIDCAMYLAACVGRALHYAHNAENEAEGRLRVIHRDVSPGNILISFDGIVKLADFGIARSNHLVRETQDGQFKGKFAYSAPEHCRGESLDGASDLFSLGVVLHEVIATRNLFTGESPSQIVHAVMEAPIPSLCEQREEVPAPLEALIRHMLQRERKQRICSGAEVANQLDAIAHEHGMAATRERMAALMQRLFSPVEMRLPEMESGASRARPARHTAQLADDRSRAARGSRPLICSAIAPPSSGLADGSSMHSTVTTVVEGDSEGESERAGASPRPRPAGARGNARGKARGQADAQARTPARRELAGVAAAACEW